MILFRPVGLEELRLVYEAGMRAFPPRLPDQPIFYPVTNEEYATQIAREWNTTSGTRAGFVTRFSVADAYAAKFERRVVGAREHEELWVPAEELADFNARLEGRVEVTRAFFGDDYRGHVPDALALRGKHAREQIVALAAALPGGGFDVAAEVAANHVAVFVNFFFWEQADLTAQGVDAAARDAVLGALRDAWERGARASIPLGASAT